jgi:hypothetical protein
MAAFFAPAALAYEEHRTYPTDTEHRPGSNGATGPTVLISGASTMGIARIAALIVIVAGIAALVYGGFSYTTESTAAKLGPLELKVREENRVNIPVWAGVAAIVAGGLVLLVSARK